MDPFVNAGAVTGLMRDIARRRLEELRSKDRAEDKIEAVRDYVEAARETGPDPLAAPAEPFAPAASQQMPNLLQMIARSALNPPAAPAPMPVEQPPVEPPPTYSLRDMWGMYHEQQWVADSLAKAARENPDMLPEAVAAQDSADVIVQNIKATMNAGEREYTPEAVLPQPEVQIGEPFVPEGMEPEVPEAPQTPEVDVGALIEAEVDRRVTERVEEALGGLEAPAEPGAPEEDLAGYRPPDAPLPEETPKLEEAPSSSEAPAEYDPVRLYDTLPRVPESGDRREEHFDRDVSKMHPEYQRRFAAAQAEMAEMGHKVTLTNGLRHPEVQDWYQQEGDIESGGRTNVERSLHEVGVAGDVMINDTWDTTDPGWQAWGPVAAKHGIQANFIRGDEGHTRLADWEDYDTRAEAHARYSGGAIQGDLRAPERVADSPEFTGSEKVLLRGMSHQIREPEDAEPMDPVAIRREIIRRRRAGQDYLERVMGDILYTSDNYLAGWAIREAGLHLALLLPGVDQDDLEQYREDSAAYDHAKFDEVGKTLGGVVAGHIAPVVAEIMIMRRFSGAMAGTPWLMKSRWGRWMNKNVFRPLEAGAYGSKRRGAALGVLEGFPTDIGHAMLTEDEGAGAVGIGSVFGALFGALLPGRVPIKVHAKMMEDLARSANPETVVEEVAEIFQAVAKDDPVALRVIQEEGESVLKSFADQGNERAAEVMETIRAAEVMEEVLDKTSRAQTLDEALEIVDFELEAVALDASPSWRVKPREAPTPIPGTEPKVAQGELALEAGPPPRKPRPAADPNPLKDARRGEDVAKERAKEETRFNPSRRALRVGFGNDPGREVWLNRLQDLEGQIDTGVGRVLESPEVADNPHIRTVASDILEAWETKEISTQTTKELLYGLASRNGLRARPAYSEYEGPEHVVNALLRMDLGLGRRAVNYLRQYPLLDKFGPDIAKGRNALHHAISVAVEGDSQLATEMYLNIAESMLKARLQALKSISGTIGSLDFDIPNEQAEELFGYIGQRFADTFEPFIKEKGLGFIGNIFENPHLWAKGAARAVIGEGGAESMEVVEGLIKKSEAEIKHRQRVQGDIEPGRSDDPLKSQTLEEQLHQPSTQVRTERKRPLTPEEVDAGRNTVPERIIQSRSPDEFGKPIDINKRYDAALAQERRRIRDKLRIFYRQVKQREIARAAGKKVRPFSGEKEKIARAMLNPEGLKERIEGYIETKAKANVREQGLMDEVDPYDPQWTGTPAGFVNRGLEDDLRFLDDDMEIEYALREDFAEYHNRTMTDPGEFSPDENVTFPPTYERGVPDADIYPQPEWAYEPRLKGRPRPQSAEEAAAAAKPERLGRFEEERIVQAKKGPIGVLDNQFAREVDKRIGKALKIGTGRGGKPWFPHWLKETEAGNKVFDEELIPKLRPRLEKAFHDLAWGLTDEQKEEYAADFATRVIRDMMDNRKVSAAGMGRYGIDRAKHYLRELRKTSGDLPHRKIGAGGWPARWLPPRSASCPALRTRRPRSSSWTTSPRTSAYRGATTLSLR
jgi:hypothetical protein